MEPASVTIDKAMTASQVSFLDAVVDLQADGYNDITAVTTPTIWKRLVRLGRMPSHLVDPKHGGSQLTMFLDGIRLDFEKAVPEGHLIFKSEGKTVLTYTNIHTD